MSDLYYKHDQKTDEYQVFDMDNGSEYVAGFIRESDAADYCTDGEVLREENELLKSDLQYVREENELLKERNAVLLQALVDYFNTIESGMSDKGFSAHMAVVGVLQKYAAL